jgi:hypothetical protein
VLHCLERPGARLREAAVRSGRMRNFHFGETTLRYIGIRKLFTG